MKKGNKKNESAPNVSDSEKRNTAFTDTAPFGSDSYVKDAPESKARCYGCMETLCIFIYVFSNCNIKVIVGY